MSKRPDLAVFGSGAWGTALAMAWAREGANVALWGQPAEAVEELARTGRHPRLPGAELPPTVLPVVSPAEAFGAPIWISAIPTQFSPEAWAKLKGQAQGIKPELMIHASKGILQENHQRLSQVLGPLMDLPIGVLSGPTFADEVARNLPTTIVLALPESIADERARQLQALLATQRLRVYLSRDIIGVELCGHRRGPRGIPGTGPQRQSRPHDPGPFRNGSPRGETGGPRRDRDGPGRHGGSLPHRHGSPEPQPAFRRHGGRGP